MSSKKQQLLDTALALFVEQGIEATATAHIAKTAGVANGTLFHHFANKRALVNALFSHIKGQLAEAMTKHHSDDAAEVEANQFYLRGQRSWRAGLEWALAHPQQLQFLQQIHYHPEDSVRQHTMEQLFAFFDQMLEQGQQQGIFAPQPLPLVSHCAHTQFLSCAAWFIEHPPADIDQAITESYQMFWRMIGGEVVSA